MSDQPKHTFTLELTDTQALLIADCIEVGMDGFAIADMNAEAMFKAATSLRNQVLRPLTHTPT